MHHVVALTAKRQKTTCTNRLLSRLFVECYVSYVQGLMQNYYRVGGLTRSNFSISKGSTSFHPQTLA
ncbi:hypothetical protein Hanom_Chr07g00656931 [Helianthus anomalus]